MATRSRAAALTLVVLLGLAGTAPGGQEEWLQGNRIKLRPGGFDGTSLLTMEVGQGGDVWVRREVKQQETVKGVTLLLVGGKAVAVTGDDVPSGKELELLDTAGLQVQLVEHILARAYPQGPSSVKGRKTIAITEKKEPIRIGTTGAKGYFSPPWRVTGEATPLAPDKVGFEFVFSFSGEKKKSEKLAFAGIWHRDPEPPRFDDRLPLTGWKIYLLGTRTDQGGGYATAETERYQTLGDLRAAIAKLP